MREMPDLRLGVGSEDGVEPGAGMLDEEARGVEGGRRAIAMRTAGERRSVRDTWTNLIHPECKQAPAVFQ